MKKHIVEFKCSKPEYMDKLLDVYSQLVSIADEELDSPYEKNLINAAKELVSENFDKGLLSIKNIIEDLVEDGYETTSNEIRRIIKPIEYLGESKKMRKFLIKESAVSDIIINTIDELGNIILEDVDDIYKNKYGEALNLLENGECEKALDILKSLADKFYDDGYISIAEEIWDAIAPLSQLSESKRINKKAIHESWNETYSTADSFVRSCIAHNVGRDSATRIMNQVWNEIEHVYSKDPREDILNFKPEVHNDADLFI